MSDKPKLVRLLESDYRTLLTQDPMEHEMVVHKLKNNPNKEKAGILLFESTSERITLNNRKLLGQEFVCLSSRDDPEDTLVLGHEELSYHEREWLNRAGHEELSYHTREWLNQAPKNAEVLAVTYGGTIFMGEFWHSVGLGLYLSSQHK